MKFLAAALALLFLAPALPAADYHFDSTISREVLENYLSRSITMEGLLTGRGDLDDNIRMLKHTGAKFVGRALCLWGNEANFLKNLERATQDAPKLHAADPDMILQACVFEIVTQQVEQIAVPDWIFTALNQPVEKRNFRYADMIYPAGQRRDWGRNGSVPDVSKMETKLWFYYQATSYIDLGIEAIHFGQVEIMNRNDRDLANWSQVFSLVRAYAAKHAKRHMVICDGHVPSGGLVRDGKLLLDFHSFPLRIMEVPDKPQEAILKVGFSDGIYGKSKGGQTFSGWKCDHLPYLVEIDNFGVSRQPGKPGAGGIWIWGYDEITWLAQQSDEYRNEWLKYAWDWVRQTDPAAHLQMPGSRTLRSPLDGKRWYYANNKSAATPEGFAQEEAIRQIWADDSYKPFDGEKSTWHEGFDRYDFVMDEATLAITPFKAPEGEKFAVRDPAAGQRRCVVIVPKKIADGQPWSWRGCYWDHQPQTEIELLRRGFHIAYISANATLKPGRQWDAWYAFLTDHGLSKKPAFIGMSRGGEYAYTFATTHPENVSCIYADNPGANAEIFSKLGDLARQDVPLLHVCGSIDPLLGKNSSAIEAIYQQLGGRISVMIKEGAGHHPHSLRDPTPIADFIEQSVREKPPAAPKYLAGRITRNNFYGIESIYRDFAKEGTHITCRGPLFSDCYNRYSFELAGVEGSITIIEPKTPATGMPWLFRSSFVPRDSLLDLELLKKGFQIVTGPVPYNADGPKLAHWDALYKHLIENGFSKRPIMEGAGRAAGDVYAWAIANPDKVSCIYAENPIFRSTMSSAPLLENLAPLAKAGIPLLTICGSLDPALEENTRVLEKRYQQLGGRSDLIVIEGKSHSLQPLDPQKAVEFISSPPTNPASP